VSPRRLPVVSGAQVVHALEKDGFQVISTKGSHRKLRRGRNTVIVPLHNELATGTLVPSWSQAWALGPVGVIPSMRTLGGLLLLLVVVVLLLSAQAGQRRVGHQVGAGRGQETGCPAVGERSHAGVDLAQNERGLSPSPPVVALVNRKL